MRTSLRSSASRIRALAAATAIGLLLTSMAAVPSVAEDGSSSAAGQADTTPPSLKVWNPARFLLGEQVELADESPPWFTHYFRTDAEVRWRARDNAGICDVEVYWQPFDDPLLLADDLPRAGTLVDPNSTNYDGAFGGGIPVNRGWWVKAYDCEGNSRSRWVGGGQPVVVQEDGTHVGPDVQFEYRGGWKRVNCGNCLAGGAKRTSRRGATASVDVPGGTTVAIVLRKGPRFGSARILVNGEVRGRINTHADETQDGVIVWTRKVVQQDEDVTITVRPRTKNGRTALIVLDALLYRMPQNFWDFSPPE